MKSTIDYLKGLPTPRSLEEAIEQSFCCGAMSEMPERTYLIIRDFLAQKFGVAVLENDDKTSDMLRELFEKIVARR